MAAVLASELYNVASGRRDGVHSVLWFAISRRYNNPLFMTVVERLIMRLFWSRLHRSAFSNVLAVVFGAALFIFPSVLNGFPFLAADSSRYLTHTIRLWSSPFYGWFIYLCHFDTFIWGVAIVQNLVIAHLVLVVTRLHVPSKYCFPIFFGVATCLTAFSSLPYFSGLIMPDVFAAVMILALYFVLFRFSELYFAEKVYFLFLILFSAIVHFSNLPLALSMISIAAMLMLLFRYTWATISRRIGLALAPLALAMAGFFSRILSFIKYRTISGRSELFARKHDRIWAGASLSSSSMSIRWIQGLSVC